MTQTYQKTFWKNEHNLEVPVALEDWPKKAKYMTVDKDGRTIYWTDKPQYDDFLEWCNDRASKGRVVEDESSERIGGAHDIWERPY